MSRPAKKAKKNPEEQTPPQLTRYIHKLFKDVIIRDGEVGKKHTLASDTTEALNLLMIQLHQLIMEGWKVYSAKHQKKLMTEDDIVFIVQELFGNPCIEKPELWQLQQACGTAVNKYLNSKAQDRA